MIFQYFRVILNVMQMIRLEIDQSLEILNNWFKLNKLTINVDKTKVMIYRKKRHILPINVNLNNLVGSHFCCY